VFYVLYVLMVGLLCAQAALPVTQGWHQLMELGVVSESLGLMAWWKRHTATVLDEDDAILYAREQRASQRRDYPLTPVQARYLVVQARHAMHHRHAAFSHTHRDDADGMEVQAGIVALRRTAQGNSMDTVISLGTPDLDWEVLTRVVERTGTPIWLELDGTIQGVLLPTSEAHRLLGRYTHGRAAASAPLPDRDQP